MNPMTRTPVSLLRRLAPSLVVLPVLALAGACSLATMVVPPELESVPAWAVRGSNPRVWNRPISFGPYRTGPLRDRGTLSVSRGGDDFGAGFAWRPFGFALDGPGGEVTAACHAFRLGVRVGGVEVDLGDTVVPALLCAFEDASGREIGRLRLELRRGRDYVGTLAAPGLAQPLAVRSIHQLERTRLPVDAPAGYEVARVGGAIAAVETVGAGSVRLGPEIDAALRDPIAATATALLLFRPELE